jgi:hypothetical protein
LSPQVKLENMVLEPCGWTKPANELRAAIENMLKSVSENRESGRFFQSCQIGSGDEPEIRSAWVL